jgi:hypothetical protein
VEEMITKNKMKGQGEKREEEYRIRKKNMKE